MKIFKLIFSIWLTIVGIILILSILAGIYFYYFHVFKTARVCITDEVEDLNAYCESNEDCISFVMSNISIINENSPNFLKNTIEEITRKSIYCETTCKQKKIYSNVFGDNQENIESCKEGEEEITVDLHGKELWQLFRLTQKEQN